MVKWHLDLYTCLSNNNNYGIIITSTDSMWPSIIFYFINFIDYTIIIIIIIFYSNPAEFRSTHYNNTYDMFTDPSPD